MEEKELVREAMRVIGSRTSEAKARAARENGKRYGGNHIVTDEMRDKMRQAQAARRERERTERAALGLAEAEPTEKRRPGRPRTRPAEETQEKRPRGRPRKTEGSQASA